MMLQLIVSFLVYLKCFEIKFIILKKASTYLCICVYYKMHLNFRNNRVVAMVQQTTT